MQIKTDRYIFELEPIEESGTMIKGSLDGFEFRDLKWILEEFGTDYATSDETFLIPVGSTDYEEIEKILRKVGDY